MIKKILLILFLFVLIPSDAKSQELVTKVAIVDVQKLLSESDASKSLFKQVKDKREEFASEFSLLEQKFNKMKIDLLEKKKDFSKEEFQKKGRAFEKKVFKTSKLAQQKRAELDVALNKGIEQIKKEITVIVSNVSKKRGFNLVLTSNNVIIFEKSIDLTVDVMAVLNKNLNKIDLELGNGK